MARITYDPEKFNLSTAKIKKNGLTFEIVVNPDEAIEFREKKLSDVSLVIKSPQIFANAQKGQLAPNTTFKEVFNTENEIEICKIILEKGEICLTAEHRKKEIENKRKKIIDRIHKFGVDPRTNAPHTISRIEQAIKETKIQIDEFKPIEIQTKEIIKKLIVLLPIRFETKEINVNVEARYAHSTFNYLKTSFKMLRSTWGNDKSWVGTIEIPGGLEEEFHDKLNKLTHGTAFTKIVKHS